MPLKAEESTKTLNSRLMQNNRKMPFCGFSTIFHSFHSYTSVQLQLAQQNNEVHSLKKQQQVIKSKLTAKPLSQRTQILFGDMITENEPYSIQLIYSRDMRWNEVSSNIFHITCRHASITMAITKSVVLLND